MKTIRLPVLLAIALLPNIAVIGQTVEVGFSGYYRPNCWTQLIVTPTEGVASQSMTLRFSRGLVYRFPATYRHPFALTILPEAALAPPLRIETGETISIDTQPVAHGQRLILMASDIDLGDNEIGVIVDPDTLPVNVLAYDGIDWVTLNDRKIDHDRFPETLSGMLAALGRLDRPDQSASPSEAPAPLASAWEGIPRSLDAPAGLAALFPEPPPDPQRAMTAVIVLGGTLLTMLSALVALRALNCRDGVVALATPSAGLLIAAVLTALTPLGPQDVLFETTVVEGASGLPWFAQIHHSVIDRRVSGRPSATLPPNHWPMPRHPRIEVDAGPRLIVDPLPGGMERRLGAGGLRVTFDVPEGAWFPMASVTTAEIGDGIRIDRASGGWLITPAVGLPIGPGLLIHRGRVAEVPQLGPQTPVHINDEALGAFTGFAEHWRRTGAGDDAPWLTRLAEQVFRGRLGTDRPVFVGHISPAPVFHSPSGCRIIRYPGLIVVWGTSPQSATAEP